MLSLSSLFEETKNEASSLSKKQKKKLGRSNKYIKDTSLIPDFYCPEVGSQEHNRDVEMIKHYFDNQSLSNSFLKLSDESCKKIFKKFCEDNNLNVNWDFLKEGLKDVNSIVFTLKQKYNRPRPKELLKIENDMYDEIIEVDSPSFPSGHTTTAYFISSVLSDIYPEEASNLKMLSELIGQSRIENCVHYPSDVIHGQFLGELLSSLYLNELESKKYNLSDFKIKRKDEKILAEKIRNTAMQNYGDEYDNQRCIDIIIHDMCEFIVKTCSIENINLNHRKCLEDVSDFVLGYPVKNIKNKHVKNQIKLMIACNKCKNNNVIDLINLHKQFDKECLQKGKPGMLRYYNHSSSYGNSYSVPKDIISHLQTINKATNPFVKHVLYEWIHPFCDGNGRTGRIILLNDLDFDFKKVNDFCNKNYLKTIHSFVDKYKDIKNVLMQ